MILKFHVFDLESLIHLLQGCKIYYFSATLVRFIIIFLNKIRKPKQILGFLPSIFQIKITHLHAGH